MTIAGRRRNAIRSQTRVLIANPKLEGRETDGNKLIYWWL